MNGTIFKGKLSKLDDIYNHWKPKLFTLSTETKTTRNSLKFTIYALLAYFHSIPL